MASTAKKYTLTLIKKKYAFQNICMFYFSSNISVEFNAGQYLQLHLPHEADERGSTRYFSISSSPAEEYIIITTKKPSTTLPTGRQGLVKKVSSFKKKLFSLKEGETIEAFGPMGAFTLELDLRVD